MSAAEGGFIRVNAGLRSWRTTRAGRRRTVSARPGPTGWQWRGEAPEQLLSRSVDSFAAADICAAASRGNFAIVTPSSSGSASGNLESRTEFEEP
jgi:hypothetical protein